nr:ABC transporter permease [Maricaulis parjimensis]
MAIRLQALAIALVVAAGVAVLVVSAGMLDSLRETRSAYYDRYRFADVWAPVVRAPDSIAADIHQLDGVAQIQTRVRQPVLFDMPGLSAPASGVFLSVPETGLPTVNRIHLTEGRRPREGQRDEIVLLDGFARAHGLAIGDSVTATIRGGRETFRVVGFALSPEFVYAIAPGQLVPDDRLFGVGWMGRDALEQAADSAGAFNEAALILQPGANERAVIDALDRLLAPWGAPGAYGREDHISDAFVSSEINQLGTMASLLPPVFLLVAAFLVNVVLTRLIAMERAQIGLLKAFGYHSRDVVWHYTKFALVIGAVGLAIGVGGGSWLGRQMAGMYVEYYHFPFLLFELPASVYAASLGVTLLAVGGGAVLAGLRAARLSPAEAMRPSPPPDYSRALGAAIARWKRFDQQSRMILRHTLRWPARAAFTMAGVAISVGLLASSMYFLDATRAMIDAHFYLSNRQDVTVSLVEPRPRAALHAIARMPGVLTAEPVRYAPARLRHAGHEERMALTGAPAEARLSRMIDSDGNPVTAPPGSIVLSRDIAASLGVEPGDRIEVEITEGNRPVFELAIANVATTLIGSGAIMEIGDLNRLLGEDALISGAWLRVDPERTDALYTQLKAAPAIAEVSLQNEAREQFETLMDEGMGTSIYIYTIFAGMIAVGVVYNSVRISFSEREHELAVLRVLGFTRGEVAYVLLGEIALLTLIALPLGCLMGAGLAWYFAQAMSSDLFRLPFIINPATFGYSALVVLIVALSSGLMVRARLNRLDMVAALKTGD